MRINSLSIIAVRAAFCLWAALNWFAAPLTAEEHPDRLRVLCYNIHHGEGVDGRLDLPRIARVIRSVSPDIVALQEVDKGAARTGRVDQPAELAKLSGMSVLFERNIDFEGGQYGNALLTRLPLAGHKNVHLPSLDDGEQRGVLIADIKAHKGRPALRFFCTHLDHRRDDNERLASAKKINELALEQPDTSAVLAGDLNAIGDSRVLAEFDQQWTRANADELPTVPVARPSRQIDYILFRPAGAFKVAEVRVLDEAVASDHRAIFAVLEVAP